MSDFNDFTGITTAIARWHKGITDAAMKAITGMTPDEIIAATYKYIGDVSQHVHADIHISEITISSIREVADAFNRKQWAEAHKKAIIALAKSRLEYPPICGTVPFMVASTQLLTASTLLGLTAQAEVMTTAPVLALELETKYLSEVEKQIKDRFTEVFACHKPPPILVPTHCFEDKINGKRYSARNREEAIKLRNNTIQKELAGPGTAISSAILHWRWIARMKHNIQAVDNGNYLEFRGNYPNKRKAKVKQKATGYQEWSIGKSSVKRKWLIKGPTGHFIHNKPDVYCTILGNNWIGPYSKAPKKYHWTIEPRIDRQVEIITTGYGKTVPMGRLTDDAWASSNIRFKNWRLIPIPLV